MTACEYYVASTVSALFINWRAGRRLSGYIRQFLCFIAHSQRSSARTAPPRRAAWIHVSRGPLSPPQYVHPSAIGCGHWGGGADPPHRRRVVTSSAVPHGRRAAITAAALIIRPRRRQGTPQGFVFAQRRRRRSSDLLQLSTPHLSPRCALGILQNPVRRSPSTAARGRICTGSSSLQQPPAGPARGDSGRVFVRVILSHRFPQ